jgi:drug/metabolite transporter (DMT)-like permease
MNALINRLPAHWRAQAWMVVAGIGFAALWGSIRWASETMHPFLVAFYRCFFGLLILAPLLIGQNRLVLTGSRFSVHARRAVSGVIGMFATFYAIAHAPMATVMSINYAAPLFATIGAVVFLNETIRFRRLAALAVGFLGILIVMRPGSLPLTPGVIASIISAVATAFSIIAVKQLADTEDPRAVVIYSFLLMVPPSFLVALAHWQWPTLGELGILLLVGASATIGQTGMVRAYALGDASALLPLDFIRFLLVILMSIVVFAEPFDGLTVLGGAIILASTIYVARREAAVSRDIPKIPPSLN